MRLYAKLIISYYILCIPEQERHVYIYRFMVSALKVDVKPAKLPLFGAIFDFQGFGDAAVPRHTTPSRHRHNRYLMLSHTP